MLNDAGIITATNVKTSKVWKQYPKKIIFKYPLFSQIGYILISSFVFFIIPLKVGNFIGIHDPELLTGLVSKGVIKREYRYNYQSWCYKETKEKVQAKATSLLFFSLFHSISQLFHWDILYSAFLQLISRLNITLIFKKFKGFVFKKKKKVIYTVFENI